MLIKKDEKNALFITDLYSYKIKLLNNGIILVKYQIDEENNIISKLICTYPLNWILKKCNVVSFEEFCNNFNKETFNILEVLGKEEEKIFQPEYTKEDYITCKPKCLKETL